MVVVDCQIIEKYYEDAVKAYAAGKIYDFFRNYMNSLIFPACGYNANLQCQPGSVCGLDKRPVLTEDQSEQVSISLKVVKNKLQAANHINNIIADRIYQNSFNLFKTKTETLVFREQNFISLYLQAMRGISGRTDVEKLVYVCPKDSNYDYLREEMVRSRPEALDKCTCYQ